MGDGSGGDYSHPVPPCPMTTSGCEAHQAMEDDKSFQLLNQFISAMKSNICTIACQTGTLTENQMTAVEGWFSDKLVKGSELKVAETLSPSSLELVSQNVAINRSCQVRFKDEEVRLSRVQLLHYLVL